MGGPNRVRWQLPDDHHPYRRPNRPTSSLRGDPPKTPAGHPVPEPKTADIVQKVANKNLADVVRAIAKKFGYDKIAEILDNIPTTTVEDESTTPVQDEAIGEPSFLSNTGSYNTDVDLAHAALIGQDRLVNAFLDKIDYKNADTPAQREKKQRHPAKQVYLKNLRPRQRVAFNEARFLPIGKKYIMYNTPDFTGFIAKGMTYQQRDEAKKKQDDGEELTNTERCGGWFHFGGDTCTQDIELISEDDTIAWRVLNRVLKMKGVPREWWTKLGSVSDDNDTSPSS